MSWNPCVEQLPTRAVAGDLAEHPVDPKPAPVQADEREPDRRVVEGPPEPLLGLLERLPGLAPRGDVLDLGDRVERLAGARRARACC